MGSLLLMIFLSSCELTKKVDFNHPVGKKKVGRSPAFSEETKERAIAACIKMKQKEHGWKSEDIRSYCEEHWKGYITFIEES